MPVTGSQMKFRFSRVIKVNPDRPQEASSSELISNPVLSRMQGALEACAKVPLLEIFTNAAVVKVAPDKPLEGVRLASLQVYIVHIACYQLHFTSTCVIFCIVCII